MEGPFQFPGTSMPSKTPSPCVGWKYVATASHCWKLRRGFHKEALFPGRIMINLTFDVLKQQAGGGDGGGHWGTCTGAWRLSDTVL